MIAELLLELTEIIGHDEAVRFIDQWQEDEAERYADEMTTIWQE